MNKLYEEKIGQFLEDTSLYDAVKTMLLDEFDLNKIDIKEKKNDHLGEITRAMITGKDLLFKAFRDMERYRKQKAKEDSATPHNAI